MSRQVQFSLDALKMLDFGLIGAAFQKEVERVVKDCLDRPGEDKARLVQLKFLFAPQADGGKIDCDRVQVQCEIISGIPKMKTKIYEMAPTANGGLRFHPDLPEDVDGNLLYDEESKKEDERNG